MPQNAPDLEAGSKPCRRHIHQAEPITRTRLAGAALLIFYALDSDARRVLGPGEPDAGVQALRNEIVVGERLALSKVIVGQWGL